MEGKAITVQAGLDRTVGFQAVEASTFSRQRMKVARLSAQRNGRLYPTVYTSGTHFR